MGWFWQPSSASPKPEGTTDGSVPSSTSSTPPAPTTPTKAPSAGSDDAADREMALFVAMLLKDTQSSSSSASSLHVAAQQQQQQQQQQSQQRQQPPPAEPKSNPDSSSWLSWGRARSRGDTPSPTQPADQQQQPHPTRTRSPQSLAMSEHVLPTTMSCRDAFDYAWHCHTPGAQWNAVYRYGSVRPCTELWDDFWFCMRTKSFSPEMRADAIRAHYRAKEEAKYGGGKPSSEDVWESREERVEPGTAFQVKFEEAKVDDAEFQRADAERRRRIRDRLDEEEGRGKK